VLPSDLSEAERLIAGHRAEILREAWPMHVWLFQMEGGSPGTWERRRQAYAAFKTAIEEGRLPRELDDAILFVLPLLLERHKKANARLVASLARDQRRGRPPTKPEVLLEWKHEPATWLPPVSRPRERRDRPCSRRALSSAGSRDPPSPGSRSDVIDARLEGSS
jgi:hypothetical protein